MEGMLSFIQSNYPVSEKDAETVIAEAKRNETVHLSAVNHLIFKIHGVAEQVGIVHDHNFPQNHLPTMLTAVKLMEEDIPSDKKRLTHKQTLELLAAGEITSAHASANRLRSFKGVKKRLERAVKLLKFREDLEGW